MKLWICLLLIVQFLFSTQLLASSISCQTIKKTWEEIEAQKSALHTLKTHHNEILMAKEINANKDKIADVENHEDIVLLIEKIEEMIAEKRSNSYYQLKTNGSYSFGTLLFSLIAIKTLNRGNLGYGIRLFKSQLSMTNNSNMKKIAKYGVNLTTLSSIMGLAYVGYKFKSNQDAIKEILSTVTTLEKLKVSALEIGEAHEDLESLTLFFEHKVKPRIDPKTAFFDEAKNAFICE